MIHSQGYVTKLLLIRRDNNDLQTSIYKPSSALWPFCLH